MTTLCPCNANADAAAPKFQLIAQLYYAAEAATLSHPNSGPKISESLKTKNYLTKHINNLITKGYEEND
jgi:hypothetical protein